MMERKDIILKIDEIASKKPSKWIEKAKEREANRVWSMKSTRIALLILNEIKSRKISQEMSQKMLAEKMGVSPQYVNKILKGQENLSLETICKIEKALGITLIEIPSYEDNRELPDNIFSDAHSGQHYMQVYSKKFEFSDIKNDFCKTFIIHKNLKSNKGLSNKIDFSDGKSDIFKTFIIYQNLQSFKSLSKIDFSNFINDIFKKSELLEKSESENIFA